MKGTEKGALLGISGKQFSLFVQRVIDATDWGRRDCEHFVLTHYKEIEDLCVLTVGIPTRFDLMRELALLAQEKEQAEQKRYDDIRANTKRWRKHKADQGKSGAERPKNHLDDLI